MERRDIAERLIDFSGRIIRLIDELPEKLAARRISDQLLRSAMSVGANYEEARGADSQADFAYKLQISLKEIRETRYWLCLISKAKLLAPDRMSGIIQEATELRSILAKSVARARGKARGP